MSDLKNKSEEMIESEEQSIEPSLESKPFIPNMRASDLRATWEMLVTSKEAIATKNRTDWNGQDIRAIAMLLDMLTNMSAQYRANMEMKEREEKDQERRAREEIQKAGGKINGKTIEPLPH